MEETPHSYTHVSQQPAGATEAPAAEYTTPAPVSSDYNSNPFLLIAKNLVTILHINPGTALLIGLALIGMGMALFAVFMILVALAIHILFIEILISLVGLVAFFAFIGLAMGTLYSVGGASLRGERLTVKGALRRGRDKIVPLVGVTILQVLVVAVGLVLLIVPGLFLGGRLALAQVIVMEENLGPIAALKRSWKLTDHHVFEMLGALLSGMLVSGSGLLLPAVSIAPRYGRYAELVALERSGMIRPKVHWLNYLALVLLIPILGWGVLVGLAASGAISIDGHGPTTTNYPSSQTLQQIQDQTQLQGQNSDGSDGFGSGTSDGSGFSSDGSGSTNDGSDMNGTPVYNVPTQ